MADVVPDTVEKTQYADTSVNKPASGTYGEKAQVERLRQALPTAPSAPGGPGGPTPMQAPPGGRPLPNAPGRPSSSTMPPNVPEVLAHRTERPNVPMSTPLMGPTQSNVASAESAKQARVAMLMALKDSPEVSETTREWAAALLQALL